jgi:outer membrane biosynthesis protein TonB
MQAYARHLNANRAPLASILTELRFDTDSSTPKLCFKPIRVLEQDELALAVKAQQDPDTLKLVTLTMKPKEEGLPSQLTSDKNTIAPSLFQKETTKEVEEPKVKVSKKKKVEPTPDVDLASLLDEFDD